jgi:lipopolysaccharide export system protein LptA
MSKSSIAVRKLGSLLPLTTAICLHAPLACFAQAKLPVPTSPQTRQAQIIVEHASHLHQDLVTGSVTATGNVVVEFTDPVDNSITTLTTPDFAYNAVSGIATSVGPVRIQRSEGTFLGDHMVYNVKTREGSVNNAIVETDYFRMRGKKITAKADGSYELFDGTFTTCIHAHPDYLVKAHTLTVTPGKVIVARDVTFYAGSTKLITLPSYKISLHAGGGAPTPLPGYNSTDGIFVQIHRTPILTQHQNFDLNLRLNFRHLPTGDISYEQDIAGTAKDAAPPSDLLYGANDPLRSTMSQLNPPIYSDYAANDFNLQFSPRSTAYALIQNRELVYNRSYSNLVISRFPEFGVRVTNILGHTPPSSATPDTRILGSAEGALQRIPGAPLLLNARASFGYLREDPTGAQAGRLALRLRAASQPILIGRRISFRVAASGWLNLYTTGSIYNILSPEAEIDYVPTRTSRFAAAYRYLSAAGKTPFLFDRRDVRNDLRLMYQVGGPWAFGIQSFIDLDHSRAYDGELAVLRNFDCMQVGISYRLRSKQINLIFNLLPPTAARERQLPIPENVKR